MRSSGSIRGEKKSGQEDCSIPHARRVAKDGSCLILIVEDDAETRQSLGEVLTAEGYEVLPATDGQEALRLLKQSWRPSLILLDLSTPRMDGWQFRDAQLSDPALASIPVMVLSGTSLSLQQARRFDARAYFTKPYDVEALLGMVMERCHG